MFKKLIIKLRNIDKKIWYRIKSILISSLLICTISILILSMYISNPMSQDTFLAGLKLFKSGLVIATFGIICGVSSDFVLNR